MKVSTVLSVLASMAVFPAVAAPTITVDSVAQNWPWSADVRVGFTLSGLSGSVDVEVEVFSGVTSLGKVAPSGDAMALVADGSYSLSFDPTTLVAGSNPVIDDMVVKLATVTSDPSWSVPLYRIYDLTQEDAAVEIVTPAKLLAGEYGAWKWTCPEPTLAAGEGVPYTNLIWTGVNQDVYKTSKLVMRYLPAMGDTVRICTMNDSAYTMPDSFYVGVFETTQKQWENVMGEAAACTFATTTSTGDKRPVETVTYKQVRGHSSANYWPQAPASGSFIDKLRAKTSDTPFDLPAAYQLTYAAEAGSRFGTAGSSFRTSTWPDGTPTVEVVDGVTVTNAAPGRYNASSTATVGNFAPSVQGLYDIIGNVSEMCVDWYFESQGAQRMLGAVANVDPEKPANSRTPSGSSTNRTRTGSNYSESQTFRHSLNYARGAVTPTAGAATIGFRLYLPAYGDEETGTAGGSAVAVSSPVSVFVCPAETAFWRTVTNSTFAVSWNLPKGATKATLSVVGMGASRMYPNLTATSQVVELPESEDVCELTLTFDNGMVETAKLGVVRGAQEGSAATVGYVNAANRAWKWVGPYAVFPVPYGATSITVDGVTTALDGACGWFGYEYPTEASLSSVALATAGGMYAAELRPRPGAILIVQ